MEATVISLDLMIALPLAAVAFAVLFAGISSNVPYLSKLIAYKAQLLGLYARSQEVASALASIPLNYEQASALITSQSSGNVSSSIVPLQSISNCSPGISLCRVVVVSGNAYLLVMRYENAS